MGGSGDGGEVDREVILAVCAYHCVDVGCDDDGYYTFATKDGEVLECIKLAVLVRRKMVQHLSRRLSIPVHHFYKPTQFGIPVPDVSRTSVTPDLGPIES